MNSALLGEINSTLAGEFVFRFAVVTNEDPSLNARRQIHLVYFQISVKPKPGMALRA
jgi:hypothetical protein